MNWKAKKRQILATYEILDDDDTPTERLLSMIADACNVDIGTVMRVLSEKDNKKSKRRK